MDDKSVEMRMVCTIASPLSINMNTTASNVPAHEIMWFIIVLSQSTVPLLTLTVP